MGLFSSIAFSQEPPRISKDELKAMLGDPNVIILDVRIYDEWKASDRKIQGATWKNPPVKDNLDKFVDGLTKWEPTIKGKTLIKKIQLPANWATLLKEAEEELGPPPND